MWFKCGRLFCYVMPCIIHNNIKKGEQFRDVAKHQKRKFLNVQYLKINFEFRWRLNRTEPATFASICEPIFLNIYILFVQLEPFSYIVIDVYERKQQTPRTKRDKKWKKKCTFPTYYKDKSEDIISTGSTCISSGISTKMCKFRQF